MGCLFTLAVLYAFVAMALTSLHLPHLWPFALLTLAVPWLVSHFMAAFTSRRGK